MDDERTRLIGSEANNSFSAPYHGSVSAEGANVQEGTVVSPISPDDLPPPYSPAQGGVPMVTCRVCQTMIDIAGMVDQYVVKCERCNEATPIKNAPPGRKYVRCPCNCLLICKSESQRIACPRPNCKRIINLTTTSMNPPLHNVPGMCRVSCIHCRETFIFNTLNNALARCPHCRKVSSVGPEYAKGRRLVFIFIALIVLVALIAMIVTTHSYTLQYPGIYVAYLGVCVILAVLLYRYYYFCTMKISTIDGPL